MLPVIVLSAKTIALGVVRAFGMMGVPVVVVHYDKRDIAHYSRYVVDKILAPHPEEEEAKFIQTLHALQSRWAGSVLVPVSDETLTVVSRHKESLSKHFIVACPDHELVQQLVDKKWTYPLAESAGIKVPRTHLPQSIGDLKAFSREIDFPCVLKPSQSHLLNALLDVKMFIAKDLTELIDCHQRCEKLGLEMMLQEYIPGGDSDVVNYNSYALDGEVKVEFTAVHIRNGPFKIGSPRVALSKHLPELTGPGRALMKALNYSGYACTEFKCDPRDGHFKLMEVNARHNLTTMLSVYCGINFPWLEYRHLVYGECPEPHPFDAGVYWVDLLRDLAFSAKQWSQERYSLKGYAQPYLGSKVWAALDLRDMRPFVNRLGLSFSPKRNIKPRMSKKTMTASLSKGLKDSSS